MFFHVFSFRIMEGNDFEEFKKSLAETAAQNVNHSLKIPFNISDTSQWINHTHINTYKKLQEVCGQQICLYVQGIVSKITVRKRKKKEVNKIQLPWTILSKYHEV